MATTYTEERREAVARAYMANMHEMGLAEYGTEAEIRDLSPARAYLKSVLEYRPHLKSVPLGLLSDDEVFGAMPIWDEAAHRWEPGFDFIEWATRDGWPVFEKLIAAMGDERGWLNTILLAFEDEEVVA